MAKHQKEYRGPAEIDSTVERLKAAGYAAISDYSGACASDEGGHYHPSFITIRKLSIEDAARLLPRKR